MFNKPLVVHKDGKIFLIQRLDEDGQVAQELTNYADIIKTPEEVYTFKLSPYSLWSAAAKGYKIEDILSFLSKNSCNNLDKSIEAYINKYMMQYRSLKLYIYNGYLALEAKNANIIVKIAQDDKFNKKIVKKLNDKTVLFNLEDKIIIKKLLFEKEFYAIDETNIIGKDLDVNFLKTTRSGNDFKLRKYQLQAAIEYLDNNKYAGGGGVIIMPPGSGKTCVGLKVIESLKTTTLIITENDSSAANWKKEILDKTDISENSIAIISCNIEESKPITISKYPHLIKNEDMFNNLTKQEWGLVIYDDAHKLPAPKYMKTIDIPSCHKLALTATLNRSDNQGNLVYALIGPKWFEILPQTLRKQGYLNGIKCVEIKVPLSYDSEEKYNSILETYEFKKLRKVAAENNKKKEALAHLIKLHQRTVIASYYVDLAKEIGEDFKIDYVSGKKDKNERLQAIDKFNKEEINCLIYTPIGEQISFYNVDVLISISYNGGSEIEEYLRLGKLMEVNKKEKEGCFFSIISTGTVEEDDYSKRRKSLINYGYRFIIRDLKDLVEGEMNLGS